MKRYLSYLLVLFITLIIVFSPFFISVAVECKSQYGDCPREINTGLKTLKFKNLVDARSKASSYLKHNFLVSSFSIQYKLPNVMLINIIAKKPYFAIKDAATKEFYLIDQKGVVISVTDSSNLPTIETEDSAKKVGESIANNNLFALNLISGVYTMYQVGYGKIVNDALVVDITHGVRVIFPLDGDTKVLLGSLRLIYTKVTTDYLGIYSQIDMRYKNPVLR